MARARGAGALTPSDRRASGLDAVAAAEPGARADAGGGRHGDGRFFARPLRIGLTGPIGCGKSTVAGWLAERGAIVIDADRVARTVTAPGTAGHDAILARFGDAVRRPDGSVDRAAVARIVFADDVALRDLEAIVHPAVRAAILDELRAADATSAPAVVIEAIKLVEGGLSRLCDEVWLVTCDPKAQRERVIARGAQPSDADQRIAGQAGLEERVRPVATRVVDTSGPLVDARARVAAAWDAAITDGRLAPRSDRGQRRGGGAQA